MNTISPLSPIAYIQSSTTQAGGKNTGQQQPQQGQSFQATVIESKPGNLFILEIGGNHISAKTDVPLSVGQNLQLQVTATTPKVELRIVSDTLQQFLGHSLTLVGKNINVGNLLQSLHSESLPLFGQLSGSSIESLERFQSFQRSSLFEMFNGEAFKNLVDRFGLSLEALLARGDKNIPGQSLKAALLEIVQLYNGSPDILKNAKELLGTLELFQLTQLQLLKNNTLIFPLPFPFLEKGYLLIDNYQNYSQKDTQENEETISFSLHLTLIELGNLKIDFNQSPEGIFLRFHSDSKEKSNFIQEYIEELSSTLSDPPILGISYSEDVKDPSSELLEKLLPEGRSFVDTRA